MREKRCFGMSVAFAVFTLLVTMAIFALSQSSAVATEPAVLPDYSPPVIHSTASFTASIYVLSGGDADADAAVVEVLETAGHQVTLGVETPEWDGTQVNLHDYDVVVMLYNENWSSAPQSAGMRALNAYLRTGGGLITGEWFIWRGSSELTEFLPATNCGWNSQGSTRYDEVVADPLISANVPISFTFDLSNYDGTESCLQPKPGATIFYTSSNGGGEPDSPGLVGWTVQAGRIASFSTLIGQSELANEAYAQLFTNTVTWAAIAGSADMTVRKAVDPAEVDAEETISYTLRLTNKTDTLMTVRSITDTLPLGFRYQPGTTNGITTTDPTRTVVDESEQLMWSLSLELPAGASRDLSFQVQVAANQPAGIYYNSATAAARQAGTAVAVLPASTVAPVEVLPFTVAEDVVIDTESGSVIDDPTTGDPTITMPLGRRTDLTVTSTIICPIGSPTQVIARHNGFEYTMSPVELGSDVYTVTIPSNRVGSGPVTISVACTEQANRIENQVADVRLFDPSGRIFDAATGLPVEGATVTLYRVPGAEPEQDCTITSARPEPVEDSGEPWSGLPDHQPSVSDERLVPNFEPVEIDPPQNPQRTNDEGRYGWYVVEGCWYIQVEAPGYEPRVSPLVGVPPEVTDLDLGLTATTNGPAIYLPLLQR